MRLEEKNKDFIIRNQQARGKEKQLLEGNNNFIIDVFDFFFFFLDRLQRTIVINFYYSVVRASHLSLVCHARKRRKNYSAKSNVYKKDK